MLSAAVGFGLRAALVVWQHWKGKEGALRTAAALGAAALRSRDTGRAWRSWRQEAAVRRSQF